MPDGDDDIRRILDAARFAAEKHAGQVRKGAKREPYINHLIEVAGLLAEDAKTLDVPLIVAGLLHDTIEDAGVTREEIAARFGGDVASLVMEVTDDKSLPKQVRKDLQVETAPKKSPRAQRLKAADKISNLRSLRDSPPADWTPERRREYAAWARRVIDGCRTLDGFLKSEFDRTHAEVSDAMSRDVS